MAEQLFFDDSKRHTPTTVLLPNAPRLVVWLLQTIALTNLGRPIAGPQKQATKVGERRGVVPRGQLYRPFELVVCFHLAPQNLPLP